MALGCAKAFAVLGRNVKIAPAVKRANRAVTEADETLAAANVDLVDTLDLCEEGKEK